MTCPILITAAIAGTIVIMAKIAVDLRREREMGISMSVEDAFIATYGPEEWETFSARIARRKQDG